MSSPYSWQLTPGENIWKIIDVGGKQQWSEYQPLGCSHVVREQHWILPVLLNLKCNEQIHMTRKCSSYWLFWCSNHKNVHKRGTGDGSPKADLTLAEDIALALNTDRSVLEGVVLADRNASMSLLRCHPLHTSYLDYIRTNRHYLCPQTSYLGSIESCHVGQASMVC